jgi:hypothetical protein
MLRIRNIEKLNGQYTRKVNSAYQIKEVVEGPQYYHFEIKVMFGPNANREFEILLDRSKEPALNRYLIMESMNGKGMWVKNTDIDTIKGMSDYIETIITNNNLC